MTVLKKALLTLAALALFASPALAVPQGTSTLFFNIAFQAGAGTAAINLATRLGWHLTLGDFGAKCDGTTDDTSAVTSAVTVLGATATPVTIWIPGTCLISPHHWTITGALSLRGENGGGFTFAPGQTLTADVFDWTTYTGAVFVRDLTLDLNGAAPGSGYGVAIFDFAHPGRFEFQNNKILNAGFPTASTSYIFLLSGYNTTSCNIADNYLMFSGAPPTHQAKSINMGGATQPIAHCAIRHNYLVGSGMLVQNGSHVVIEGNEVAGLGYGAGIALGTWAVTTFYDAVVANNYLHDSQATPDDTGDKLDGIENWANGTTITGNVVRNFCGPGITLGQWGIVTGNNISDIGNCQFSANAQSGIGIANSGGASGSGSFIEGNIVFDDGAYGSHTLYGYTDLSSTTNVRLGVNDFQAVTAAYNIVGGSSFASHATNIVTFSATGTYTKSFGVTKVDTYVRGGGGGGGGGALQVASAACSGGSGGGGGEYVAASFPASALGASVTVTIGAGGAAGAAATSSTTAGGTGGVGGTTSFGTLAYAYGGGGGAGGQLAANSGGGGGAGIGVAGNSGSGSTAGATTQGSGAGGSGAGGTSIYTPGGQGAGGGGGANGAAGANGALALLAGAGGGAGGGISISNAVFVGGNGGNGVSNGSFAGAGAGGAAGANGNAGSATLIGLNAPGGSGGGGGSSLTAAGAGGNGAVGAGGGGGGCAQNGGAAGAGGVGGAGYVTVVENF